MSETRENVLRTIQARAGVDRDEAKEILAIAVERSQETLQHVTWDEAIDIWANSQPPVPDDVNAEDWKLVKNLKISDGEIIGVLHDDDGTVTVYVEFFKPKQAN